MATVEDIMDIEYTVYANRKDIYKDQISKYLFTALFLMACLRIATKDVAIYRLCRRLVYSHHLLRLLQQLAAAQTWPSDPAGNARTWSAWKVTLAVSPILPPTLSTRGHAPHTF